MVPRREEKREEKTEGAGHRRRKAAVMPRQEGKREEKTEGAGHRRRKEAMVPRQEGKREELQTQQKNRVPNGTLLCFYSLYRYCLLYFRSGICILLSHIIEAL